MAKKIKEKALDMEAIANQKIIDVELNNEMKQSYIDYAMSVIVSRALPDVRDGMKPVHRRILYNMYDSKLLYENDFRNFSSVSLCAPVNLLISCISSSSFFEKDSSSKKSRIEIFNASQI